MISVIIPTYQSQNTLTKCLESVLNQRDVQFEVIVVDDGSTDDTQSLLNQYRERLGVYTVEHAGAPAARNFGAKQAKGDYLFFCDSDVVLYAEALKKMLVALQINPSAAYAYSAFDFNGRYMRGVKFSEYWLRRINYISTMTLIRRLDFLGFDESLTRFQDWDLWLTLLKKDRRGVAIHDKLFYTQIRAGISDGRRPSSEAEQAIRMKHGLPIPNSFQRFFWRVGFFLYQTIGFFSD